MKNIWTLIVILFLGTNLFAQQIGVKAGLNLASMNIDDFDAKNRFGYHFGGYVNIALSDALGIQPEVLYSARGVRASYDILNLEGESTLRLNYIDVPIMLTFYLGDFARLEAGPYIGFLSDSSFETEGDLGDDVEDIDNDSFNSVDYGLAGGISFNLNAFQIGARYVYGLQEIQDNQVAELIIGDASHRVVQIYGALRIGQEP